MSHHGSSSSSSSSSSNNMNNNGSDIHYHRHRPWYRNLFRMNRDDHDIDIDNMDYLSSSTPSSTSNRRGYPDNNSNSYNDDVKLAGRRYSPSGYYYDSTTWRDRLEDTVEYTVMPFLGFTLKAALGMTVVLYVLNQTHMLPKEIGSVVSKVLFWPTLPITASKRIGKWVTRIDDTVVMGGAPFGFLQYPAKLKEQYGVDGVINMCEEYRGPIKQYKQLGIEELYLPTTDHFEPSREDIMSALSFIKRHQAQGKTVYVHCRAGHGRSGAVVFAWLLLQDPTVDPQQLNAEFCQVRNVRSSLWKQPNIRELHRRFQKTPGVFDDIHDTFFQQQQQHYYGDDE